MTRIQHFSLTTYNLIYRAVDADKHFYLGVSSIELSVSYFQINKDMTCLA